MSGIPYEPDPPDSYERCDNCRQWCESTIPHPTRTMMVQRRLGDEEFVERRVNQCVICHEAEFGPIPDPPEIEGVPF